MNENIQYPEFFEQLEPLLLKAGYDVTYGHFATIRKGRFIANLLPYHHEVGNGYHLCFYLIVRTKDLKQLSIMGGMVLANALAMNHPGFNIVYHQRGCGFSLRYHCDLYEPKDILYQLEHVNECNTDLRNDMKKRLPDFIKQFPCSNTPDKQLVNTLRYLHRWHLE